MSTQSKLTGSRLEVVVTSDGRRIRRFHLDTSKIDRLPAGCSAEICPSDRWSA